jgi:hypothetical protein
MTMPLAAMNFPSGQTKGANTVTSNGLYLFDGYSWTGDWRVNSPDLYTANRFLYRTIYTRGYTSNGYASGTPWNTVYRTVHSTDTTTNIGNLQSGISSYIDGGWSDYYHYVYNISGAVGGTSNVVSSISMAVETARTPSTSWYMATARANLGALMNSSLSCGYITGGNSATTDKHNFATETMYAAGSAANSPTAGGTTGGISRWFGATYGWAWANSAGGYLTWSTETWTSGTQPFTTDGQPKGHSTKQGWAYCATGTYNGSSYYYQMNDITNAVISSSITRPESCGEENQQTGQNWGYTIGSYNGSAQTNNCQKLFYLTGSCIAMGSNTQPSAHAGMSSGACGSASALVLGGS